MKKNFIWILIFMVSWTATVIFLADTHILIAVLIAVAGVISTCYLILRMLSTLLLGLQLKLELNESVDVFRLPVVLEEAIESQKKRITTALEGIRKITSGEGMESFHIQDEIVGKALREANQIGNKVKHEEFQRKWISDGLAHFSKVLSDKSDLSNFCKNVLTALIKYLKVNQGGIYLEVSANGERFLELKACFAYDRKKYLEKRIALGEGALGQCMFEKDFIFLTDVPKDYINITSGLGYAVPRNIVVAPLITRGEFLGAIELATFEILSAFEVEFLKKVCDMIAAELVAINSLEKMRLLLDDSKALTTKLQKREEEMQTNLRDLTLAQKEAKRKQVEIDNYLSAINITIASAEFSPDGNFINGNDIFLKLLGYTKEELLGRSYLNLISGENTLQTMWENLQEGRFFSGEFKLKNKAGQENWLVGTLNPIKTPEGWIEKIMMLAQFTTQEKERIHDLSEIVTIVKNTVPMAEFTDKFILKNPNEQFIKLFGSTRAQMRGKSIYDFIYNGTMRASAIQDILSRGSFSGTLSIVINNHPKLYRITVSRSVDLNGRLNKHIMILLPEVEITQQEKLLSAKESDRKRADFENLHPAHINGKIK